MAHSLDPIVDKIIVARVGLLLRHPFFGNMATRLKIQEGGDWCKTAATDGRTLFYCREFFNKLSAKQVEFVVAHEILHNVFDHIARTEGRNKQIWNAAIDYAVNGQLVRDRIGDHNFSDIKIYHDPKHYGKSAEQIYDEIYDEEDQKSMDALGQLLDQHIDWQGDGEDGAPQYSKEEMKQIRDEIREAVMQAASAAGAGNVPGNIQRMIKELTEPKMNWRDILRQQIQSTIRSDFTFARPSRKGWHTGAILPGMNFQETIDICVSIDMSGSIGDDQAKDFLSEIKGIMEEYKDNPALDAGLLAAAQAVERVKLRVLQGGHHVPDGDVSRRFERSTRHFLEDYLPLADVWTVWDNHAPPSVIIADSDTCSAKELAALLNPTTLMETPPVLMSPLAEMVLEASRAATTKMLDYYKRMGIRVTPQMTLAPEPAPRPRRSKK
jgi:predicted metal-dependent peptidase